jgi:hypothetical protein
MLWDSRLDMSMTTTHKCGMAAADDIVYGRLCYNGYLVLHDLLYGLANSGCLPRAFCLAVPLELQLEQTIAPNLIK